jgi:NAD(P)-dependent dehydrogenase (short-subunit alcohol dehydrogenase family)
MLQKDWGGIVFISSESGVSIPVEMVHYGVTKTKQIALARGLAEATTGSRVTVNSVLSGPTHVVVGNSPNATRLPATPDLPWRLAAIRVPFPPSGDFSFAESPVGPVRSRHAGLCTVTSRLSSFPHSAFRFRWVRWLRGRWPPAGRTLNSCSRRATVAGSIFVFGLATV